jgi:hypothetical protein
LLNKKIVGNSTDQGLSASYDRRSSSIAARQIARAQCAILTAASTNGTAIDDALALVRYERAHAALAEKEKERQHIATVRATAAAGYSRRRNERAIPATATTARVSSMSGSGSVVPYLRRAGIEQPKSNQRSPLPSLTYTSTAATTSSTSKTRSATMPAAISGNGNNGNDATAITGQSPSFTFMTPTPMTRANKKTTSTAAVLSPGVSTPSFATSPNGNSDTYGVDVDPNDTVSTSFGSFMNVPSSITRNDANDTNGANDVTRNKGNSSGASSLTSSLISSPVSVGSNTSATEAFVPLNDRHSRRRV